MGERILIIEDDEELGAELVRQLQRASYHATWIRDGDEALEASLDEVDLVLLDLVLPGTYGLDVLKSYRARSVVPIILLTARSHTADKVRGLSLGADDYITKPFWPEELLARVRARLRRPSLGRDGGGVVRAGALEVDLDARAVKVGGATVELTRVELELLEALARRAGRAVARSVLVEHTLDSARGGGERTLDVHVSRIRKKLGPEGQRVATVWGIGYRLEVDR
ncbi:MAG: response regulator transcription factor [Deltaproteobacteria bacterium]|nr:response regulator transcription factor [Deltaproteobacteria bacterium]